MDAVKPSFDPLVSVSDSVLMVVDVQDHFLDKLAGREKRLLTNRIGWMVAVATRLRVPVLATAEDMDKLGSISPAVLVSMPDQVPILNKMVFGLANDSAIMAELASTGRRTAVLVGMETDVCVAQSALGLLQANYRVVALADATASPGNAHQAGLERMRGAGVVISTVKSLYYEWMRTVAAHEAFMSRFGSEIGLPDGIEL